MTRYARAKGSKASNERLPNDPTPWHVMKQQLTQNQTTSATKNIKTAKELLSEKQELSHNNVNENTNSWASFDDDKVNKNRTDNTVPKVKNIKNRVSKKAATQAEQGTDVKDDKREICSDNKNQSQIQVENNEKNSQKYHQVLSKRQKRNMRKQNKSSCNSNAITTTNEATNKDNNTTLYNLNYSDTNYPPKFNNTFINKSNNFNNNFNQYNNKVFKQSNKRKVPKIRDDKEHKRRKPDFGPMKIMLNGVEVEIVKYDGFPVKKEDAERLKELRQKMVMQGIPKSEIDSAMKLERRRAEKELARAKRHVCFHCRKSGHNLSDCPELANEQSGTGICFKCGSTEHTHFECKITRALEYRYATCFICREQGHISKQCPDNPRGIYPDGGACKICGDVTHLKKDCPDLTKDKEASTITVDKITDTTLESLDADTKENESCKDNKNTKNKIVKF